MNIYEILELSNRQDFELYSYAGNSLTDTFSTDCDRTTPDALFLF
ncbi:hypothetical protein [Aerosakkonema funiforme]|nr:hypothetical protein [Aerosakkonema funiforme]